MNKNKPNILCILTWIVYPILFVVFFCFCFFTCSNKGLQTRDKKDNQESGIYAKEDPTLVKTGK